MLDKLKLGEKTFDRLPRAMLWPIFFLSPAILLRLYIEANWHETADAHIENQYDNQRSNHVLMRLGHEVSLSEQNVLFAKVAATTVEEVYTKSIMATSSEGDLKQAASEIQAKAASVQTKELLQAYDRLVANYAWLETANWHIDTRPHSLNAEKIDQLIETLTATAELVWRAHLDAKEADLSNERLAPLFSQYAELRTVLAVIYSESAAELYHSYLDTREHLDMYQKISNYTAILAALLFGLMLLYAFLLSRVEEWMRESNQKADVSSTTTQFYLNMLSQEIHAPVASSLESIRSLKSQKLSPGGLASLRDVEKSTENVLSVVQNIMSFRDAAAPKMVVTPERMSLKSCIDSCFSILRYAVPEEVSVRYDIASDVPEYVMCDGTQISQILLNLLGNAVKFTRKGEVYLELTREPDRGGKLALRFVLRDTGYGIAAEDQGRIFENYVRAEAGAVNPVVGTGLGLALVDEMVKDMGGRIFVCSAPGAGASFKFTILLDHAPVDRRVARSSLAEVPRTQERRSQAMPRVLVVEDNPVNQLVAIRMLEKLGIDAQSANDGLEAVEKAMLESYDLIFMDLQMPELDGIAATQRILAALDPAPHIVAMTANVLAEERRRCHEAGMIDFVGKPIKLKTLSHCLSRLGLL